ncbi:MAG: hypothetical protein FVQ83_10765 [Chloroflexi bacterium]|nr:hypothetical protein [Chloroflexota bacterium]
MLFETLIIGVGIGLLIATLFLASFMLMNIKIERAVEGWVLVQAILVFVMLGFGIILIYLLGYPIIPLVTLETITAFTLLLSTFLIVSLYIVLWIVFRQLFGLRISDKNAIIKFLRFAKLPNKAGGIIIKKKFQASCDKCKNKVNYTIADVVRSHPDIKRGIYIEHGLGEINYNFYVRHQCEREIREIPVQHDAKLEYRNQKPSRLVIRI